MGLPAPQGLSVLYAIADEWMWRRDVLTLLGAKDPGRLDSILDEAGMATPADRAGQVVAAGGEIG